MRKHPVAILAAAAALAFLLPLHDPAAADCNSGVPLPPLDPEPTTGPPPEGGGKPPADPPPTEGGTPTPPDSGGGTPSPPGGAGQAPPPPSAGSGPGGPPGGRPGGATGPAKSSNMSEWGLESWEDWWHVYGDRYLDLRHRVRESERLAATAPGSAAPADAGTGWKAEARRLLLDAFHDGDWTVRASAAIALGRAGCLEALPEFVRMGRTPVRDVRGSAAVGAGLLGDPLVVEDLGRIASNPAEPEHLRGIVLVSLGLIGGPEAAGVLLDYLDPAADARRAGGIGRTQLLEETAVAALGMSGDDRAAPFLRRVLASGARPVRTRAFAATSLARLGDRGALPLLRQALRSDEVLLRQAGAVALGVAALPGDESTVADLVRASREERDATTRRFALLSLGRIGGDAARADLLDLLTRGRQADLPYVVLALGVGGVREAGPALGALFRETRDPEVRGALAVSLGLLRWTDAAPDLLAAARSTAHHHLRGDCLVSLGLMGDRAALEPARAALDAAHPDEELVADASVCLALLGDRAAIRRLPGILREGLDHAHTSASYRVLGMLGGPGAFPELASMVRDGKSDRRSRAKAVEAVGALLDDHDLPVLATVPMDCPFLLLQGPMRAVMGHR